MKKLILLIVGLSLAFCVWAYYSNTVHNASTIEMQFSSLKNHQYSNYYSISKDFDLRGSTLKLPLNSILEFKGGKIINGIVIGDSTTIIGANTYIFDNIVLSGSWKITDISTDLFENIDTMTASNLSVLSSDRQFNRIVINHNLQVPIKPWSSSLTIKSNTDVVLNANLYTMPTKYKGGYCMNIVGENINIIGNGHFLFGTLPSAEQRECYEWLHGLNIDSKSCNISVKNLKSWLFCGDGFYNGGSNVEFDAIDAQFNGRQGLSITNGKNITINKSLFSHMGYYRICTGKGPGAGINIEPNEGNAVQNVIIDNCMLTDNYKYMQGHINDLEIYGAKSANINISNSMIGGLYLGTCSEIKITDCSQIRTIYGINSDILNVVLKRCGEPVLSEKIQKHISVNGD